MRAVISLVAVVALASIGHAYRDCFVCDSDGDFKSAKACKEKRPDGYKMNAIRVPDDGKECYLCYKKVDDNNNRVERGCLDKDSYKDDIEDEYDFKNTDQCKKNNNIEYCVCEGNLCNGGSTVVYSIVTLFIGMALRILV